MSEHFSKKEDKMKDLKELIKKIHEGSKPEEVKEEFKDILKSVSTEDISQVEEELIKEGMPIEEIHKLCEVHLALLKDSHKEEKILAPEGHPIHTLMEEHKMLLKFMGEFKKVIEKIKGAEDFGVTETEMERIKHIEEHLKESESHYLREENILFPYLQKHGVTQPPTIMWMEHDKIRETKKTLYKIIDEHKSLDSKDFIKQLEDTVTGLDDMLSNHFFKENNILFTAALQVIEEDEWKDARQQFDEIGYCCFSPEHAKADSEKIEMSESRHDEKAEYSFETGTLLKEQIEAVFNTLPVEITFVDKDDTLRYFNQKKDMIFERTKAALGLKVQQCHPQKSVHLVNQILEDFKSGKRDVADFRINIAGKFVYIRYFPVHNKEGEYLGCMEVTQDITDIQKLTGEKRLLE